jgi:hypothetical protein
MKQFSGFFFILSLMTTAAFSQLGGEYTYAFLNQTNSARVAALSGKNVSLKDSDLNLSYHNPSLLDSSLSNHLVLNYVGYFSDIKYGYISYGRHFRGIGTFAAGIQYMDYGDFTYADNFGIRGGDFQAKEYALNLIYSRRIDSFFTVGINLKPIYTNFERYNSTGIAADIGINYYNPNSLFSAGLVLKNIGAQITTYYGDAEREKLPFEIQAGITQKLAHAPFRFNVTFQHLQQWDLNYEESGEDQTLDEFGQDTRERSTLDNFADNAMRHILLGVEFIPGENFYIAAGYNYLRRQELKLPARTGMVGFSVGFGFRISKFHFSYGRASYHLAGGSNHFSLSTNLSEFYRRK